MDVYALLVGAGSALLILVIAFAIIRSKNRQRKIRHALGFRETASWGPNRSGPSLLF